MVTTDAWRDLFHSCSHSTLRLSEYSTVAEDRRDEIPVVVESVSCEEEGKTNDIIVFGVLTEFKAQIRVMSVKDLKYISLGSVQVKSNLQESYSFPKLNCVFFIYP